MSSLGVDLYQHYNTVTNWTALAGAVDFAWIKVTDGTGQAVVHADAYQAACEQHNIPWGGYHFAEPGNATAQADAFVAQLQRLGGWRLAPALDIESGGIPVASRAGFSREFLERVHAKLGCRVAIYSSSSWLESLRPDSWPYQWDVTWTADYGVNNGARHAIGHYSGRTDCHQYTSVGSIAGVAGHVDLDWTDNLAALMAQEEDMPLNDADVAKIWGYHRANESNDASQLMWNAAHYAQVGADPLTALASKVDALAAAVAKLQTTQASGGIDLAALAKAVNDDAAARMKS